MGQSFKICHFTFNFWPIRHLWNVLIFESRTKRRNETLLSTWVILRGPLAFFREFFQSTVCKSLFDGNFSNFFRTNFFVMGGLLEGGTHPLPPVKESQSLYHQALPLWITYIISWKCIKNTMRARKNTSHTSSTLTHFNIQCYILPALLS